MSTQLIDQCLFLSNPVQLTPRQDTALVEDTDKLEKRVVAVRMSFHKGERRLCGGEFSWAQSRALVHGHIFDDPVCLALVAHTKPGGGYHGHLRIFVGAASANLRQKGEMIAVDETLEEGLDLWDLPGNRVGFLLGSRWFKGTPGVLKRRPVGPDYDEQFNQFALACKPFFDSVLFGHPGEEAARILESVPGIGGELASSDGDEDRGV